MTVDDDTTTPTAGAESAQGTPDEPAAPAVGDLVEQGHRFGVLVAPGQVAWLGQAERCELPLTRVG